MAKEGVIQVEGTVMEALPNTTFTVKITDEKYTNKTTQDILIRCHLSGKMRMNYIKILPGDSVTVEISPYDTTKGRITFRNTTPPKWEKTPEINN